MDKNDKNRKTSNPERSRKISEAMKRYHAEHPRSEEFRQKISEISKKYWADRRSVMAAKPVEDAEKKILPKTKQQIEQELDDKIEELERRRRAGEIDLEEFMRLRSMAVNHAEGEITRIAPPKKTYWQNETAKIRL